MIDFIIALGAFSIGLVVAIIILSIWYFTAVLLLIYRKTWDVQDIGINSNSRHTIILRISVNTNTINTYLR